jgi:putative acetyltransferase
MDFDSFTLRPAAAADVPALAALYAQCAHTLGPLVYSEAQVAAWVRFGADTPAFRSYILDATTWVLQDADGPAGFCGVGSGGEVHSLYVRPSLCRQGLGTHLLLHALAQARAAGQQRFRAWATPLSLPVFQRAGLLLVATVREPFEGVMFERYRVEGM